MLIIGHRGIRNGFIQENTLEAFSEARKGGADGAETDTFATLDDQVVISHDPIILTSKDAKRIRTSLFSELQNLLPSLDQVLEFAKRPINHPSNQHTKDFKINIEIKRIDIPEPDYNKKVVKLVVDCIRLHVKSGLKLANVIISSFDPDILSEVGTEYPEIHRRMLIGSPIDPHRREWRHNSALNQMEYKTHGDSGPWEKGRSYNSKYDGFFAPEQRVWDPTPTEILGYLEEHCKEIQPNSVALPISSLTDEVADAIRQRNAKAVVWTANEPLRNPEERNQLMRHLIAMKVETFITDFPGEYAQSYASISGSTS